MVTHLRLAYTDCFSYPQLIPAAQHTNRRDRPISRDYFPPCSCPHLTPSTGNIHDSYRYLSLCFPRGCKQQNVLSMLGLQKCCLERAELMKRVFLHTYTYCRSDTLRHERAVAEVFAVYHRVPSVIPLLLSPDLCRVYFLGLCSYVHLGSVRIIMNCSILLTASNRLKITTKTMAYVGRHA